MKPFYLKPVQQKLFTAEECNKILKCKTTYPIRTSFAENQPVEGIPYPDYEWVWERIENALLKINKRHYRFKEPKMYHSIGFKTYKKGDSYLWHHDNISLRRLTAVVFLNNREDYVGGDLRVFCGEEIVIKHTKGVLAVFPSWYFHQADEVLTGEIKVLITFLTGPQYDFFI